MTPQERAQLVKDITEAVSLTTPLTDDEQRWVRMAIRKEAQSIDLRNAIIEKTLVGLAWLLVLGLGALVVDFAKNHGFK